MCQSNQSLADSEHKQRDATQTKAPFVLDLQLAFFVMASLLLSAKWITLLLLPLLAIRSSKASRLSLILRCVAILVLAAIPIDVGIPFKHNGLMSDGTRSGPRLVRAVAGMPMHTALIAKYGEYWTLSCSGRPCMIQPRYIFVWWNEDKEP